MSLFGFILLCVVAGLVVGLLWQLPLIPAEIKQLILWATIIVLVLILVQALGLFGSGPMIPKLG